MRIIAGSAKCVRLPRPTDDQRPAIERAAEEEGDYADQVVDIAKFQNFWFTILAVAGYALLAIRQIDHAASIGVVELLGFNETIFTLLAISHAGYLAGKLPSSSPRAPGLTVQTPEGFNNPNQAAQRYS